MSKDGSNNTVKAIDESATSLSLLARLRDDPTDQRSWDEFASRYGRRIYGWCRRWGLRQADADDVKQNVLLILASQMRTFEYRPSGRFRSWLKTVAFRAWRRFVEQRHNKNSVNNIQDFDRLLRQDAEEDFLRRLDEEANRELMELAVQQVRPRVKPHTWDAFFLTTYEQLSASQAAQRLNISEGVVYISRFRIQKMLMDEVERLDGDAVESESGDDTSPW